MEQEEIKDLLNKIHERLNGLIPDVVNENSLRSIRAEEHVRTLLSIREYLRSQLYSEQLFTPYTTGYVRTDLDAPIHPEIEIMVNTEEQNEG